MKSVGGVWLVPSIGFPHIACPQRRRAVELAAEGLLAGIAEEGVWRLVGAAAGVDRDILRSVTMDAAWEAAARWEAGGVATLETYFIGLVRLRIKGLSRFNRNAGGRSAQGDFGDAPHVPADPRLGPDSQASESDLVAAWIRRLPAKCRPAAEVLAAGGSKREAAAAAGVSSSTVTVWLKTHLRPTLKALLA